MNVLSLFDGMSCGQIALERAGFKVANYFAAEIDKHAIQVAKANYPNTQHLGDVREVKAANLPPIDLLIGGSPCQGFSFAGKQLSFDDPRSALFFEFVRLLDETEPRYFLLENVRMKKEHQDVISTFLGVEPILINSALVSAQNRQRLYWTNIPGVEQPADRGVLLRDIIEADGVFKYLDRSAFYSERFTKNYLQYDPSGKGHNSEACRAYFPDGKIGSLSLCWDKSKILTEEGIRYTTRKEHERLQTVPDGYTNAAGLVKAKKMLGNGWTVDVIAHIFKGMEM